MTYDKYSGVYSYDAGVPITRIKFGNSSNMNELIKLNTSNVTSMNGAFSGCKLLTSLDASNFDTSNVTNMGQMFYSCSSLHTLDISNFDMTNVTSMDNMFGNCTSLHTLRLDNCSNYTIDKIINSVLFPTNAIEGVTRTIYCKEENAAGLVAPTNWVFSYIVEELPEAPEPEQEICSICGTPGCEYPTEGQNARCPECRQPYRIPNSSCMTHMLHGFGDSGAGN